MSLESALVQYGYLVVLVGTFLEGETVLVLAGLAAHRGYLDLPLVLVCAFLGTLCGDQLYFSLGRRHGTGFLARRPARQLAAARAQRLIDRHGDAIILGFRFLYGIRTVTPFLLGAARVPVARFTALNALAAAVWAVAIGSLGYALGAAVAAAIDDVERVEIWLFAAVALGGAGYAWLHRRRLRSA